jgi:hypothetical protein
MARKKAIDLQDYSALDSYCIGLNEFYKSLRKAGFGVDLALAIIVEPSAYPDWILPKFPEKLGSQPYDDDDED